MCELFGISAKTPFRITDELTEFFSHYPAHPNGWGLAAMQENGWNIEKESLSAGESAYLSERLSEDISTTTLFAHIRYATVGNVERYNSHPFFGRDKSGRTWTLAHNGTIFDFPALNPYTGLQQGDTDSERILLYLINRMNFAMREKAGTLSERERFTVLETLSAALSANNNKLNFLLFDGELVYVHCNLQGTLHFRSLDDGVMFSTQPLSVGAWQEVPLTTLLAYRDGELIFTGKPHGHTHKEDKKALEQLYLAYSGL